MAIDYTQAGGAPATQAQQTQAQQIAAGMIPGAQQALSSNPLEAARFSTGTQGSGASGTNKKSAGPAPDFNQAARADQISSQAAIAQQTGQNRPTINTPFGVQSWTTGPDGQPVLTTGLGGPLAGGAQAVNQQAADALSNPLDPSLFGAVPNGDAARTSAIDASYDSQASRLNPQFQQGENALMTRLKAQGIDPGSEAGRAALDQFGRNKNDAFGQARDASIAEGDRAAQSVFGMNLQEHQQALADALKRRSNPLEEAGQLAGLANNAPGFNQAGSANPLQSLSAANMQGQYGLQDTQQQNQMWGQFAQALTGLLGAPFKFIK
jgi:hypothetical protein